MRLTVADYNVDDVIFRTMRRGIPFLLALLTASGAVYPHDVMRAGRKTVLPIRMSGTWKPDETSDMHGNVPKMSDLRTEALLGLPGTGAGRDHS